MRKYRQIFLSLILLILMFSIFVSSQAQEESNNHSNRYIASEQKTGDALKECEPTSGEAIDLGLSVHWSSHNVGAMMPYEFGDYYAWGETESKNHFSEDNYLYLEDGKYKKINAITNICGSSYDAAFTTMGGEWRLPTYQDQLELRYNCTWNPATYHGVKGYHVIGPNGNSIFIPASGVYRNTEIVGKDNGTYLWSGSPYPDSEGYAYVMAFNINKDSIFGGGSQRFYGCPIRPVKTKYVECEPTTGEAIDLGLSVHWSSHNIGAMTPYEFGDYYAWGETNSKETFLLDNYSYVFDDKYLIIGSDISGTDYDVAYIKTKGEWRLPTNLEQEELLNKCTWETAIYNNVKGYHVIGPNGNSIFLPAAGAYAPSLSGTNNSGAYWSGNALPNEEEFASTIFFNLRRSERLSYGLYRYRGVAVRPVLADPTSINQPLSSSFCAKWENGLLQINSDEKCNVNIYSVDGRLVWNGQIDPCNQEEIDLAPGMYIINNKKMLFK